MSVAIWAQGSWYLAASQNYTRVVRYLWGGQVPVLYLNQVWTSLVRTCTAIESVPPALCRLSHSLLESLAEGDKRRYLDVTDSAVDLQF